ncbi:MAG TPA: hypothetical protein PK443_05430, partial [bacterium]|nr:hypothetical protein [bacterium]
MFRSLISILAIGLISTNLFALDKSKITYSFEKDKYQPWNISCPGDKEKLSTRCTKDTFLIDPVCGYHEWSVSLINPSKTSPEGYQYMMEVSKSACMGNKQKYNPTIASSFSRPDGNTACEKYVKPT